ncbi:MAG: hypothetical protein M0038_19405 [Pseudomonadota bacterium]|nr:hypothetical protein [Pseudomonadota bacterium]
MAARNKAAAARGARTREAIRQIMIQHATRNPIARPLTGKELQWHLKGLGVYLAPSTIAWHVQQIRLTADIAALDGELGCKGSNSSGEFRGA